MSYRKKHIKSKIKRIKPKRSLLKNKYLWLCILAAIVTCVVLYFLFFSRFFVINDFAISGNKNIVSEDILQAIEKNTPANIFLANLATIEKNITTKFPEIQEVKAQKKLPSKLYVTIKERIAVALFCQEKDICYHIDQAGIIFGNSDKAPDNFIAIEKEDKSNKYFPGQQALDVTAVKTITEVQKLLKDNYNVSAPSAVIISPERLNINTAEGWQIYLSTDLDFNAQIVKLDLLLREEIDESLRKKLQYIDLRFIDRAFYK